MEYICDAYLDWGLLMWSRAHHVDNVASLSRDQPTRTRPGCKSDRSLGWVAFRRYPQRYSCCALLIHIVSSCGANILLDNSWPFAVITDICDLGRSRTVIRGVSLPAAGSNPWAAVVIRHGTRRWVTEIVVSGCGEKAHSGFQLEN